MLLNMNEGGVPMCANRLKVVAALIAGLLSGALGAAPADTKTAVAAGGERVQAGGRAEAKPDVVVLPQCREQIGAPQIVEVPAGKSRLLSLRKR